ncbi:MAG TPA: M23 family metallopeptidase [Pilimelia sp.]|nr:M23 family metallopeptidase [Pilimelia sp.]
MRQRLTSEPDRYRGRRRVPTPPRSRYAAVVTSAFVGAGVVAMVAGATLQDAKTLSPSALADLEQASLAGDLAERDDSVDRASRDRDREPERGLATSMTQEAPDVWLLPVKGYRFTSPFGMRWGKLHAGVDLAVPEGTPVGAVHEGTVELARWHGGYGNCVIINHGNGVQTVYGHNSKLLVEEGQKVKAGDRIALAGNTGHSYGSHVHLEVHVNEKPKDPIDWLEKRGVSIKLELEDIYGGVAAS